MRDRCQLSRVIGAAVLLTSVAGAWMSLGAQGVVVAIGAGFVPGGQTLFATDFTQDVVGDFPRGLKLVKGSLDVVERDGVRMLRSTSPSEFIIPFSGPLPAQFTVEFDIVARGIDCCAGEELALEGSPTLARTAGSAQLLWHHQWLAILGGGRDMSNSTVKVSETLQAELLGQLGHVQIAFDGPSMKLWTNGVRLYNLPELAFRRSNVLRVFLGGTDEGDRAVYLARIRVAASGGAPGPTTVAQRQPPHPVGDSVGGPLPQDSAAVPQPPEQPRPSGLERTRTVNTVPSSDTTTAALPIQVGTGISDITGPMAEVGLLGYGKFDQPSMGLHTRLFARAFLFADQAGDHRVAFVSAELGMLYSSVKEGVLAKLAARYGDRYTDANVMVSATHTHAGPGGFSHHAIYNLGTKGFITQNYNVIVDGIAEAIGRADSTLGPATVSVMTGEVAEATQVNRSMKAFRLNPEAQTADPVDRAMTVLKIERNGRPVGAIAWHAVHNTSMTNQNSLISSDHKGYAAYLFEKQYGSIAPLRNYGAFVAAFPNGAEGDMSPNLNGATAGGIPPCEGAPRCGLTGPGRDQFESATIIGEREFSVAHSLFQSAGQTPVGGLIDSRHSFVFMPAYVVTDTKFTNGVGGRTLCPAAYGASFMAGAEDGPSGPLPEGLVLGSTMAQADLEQARLALVGLVSAAMLPLAPVVADLMLRSAALDVCQFPKPVLIPTGALPNWTPETLPFQLLRIGPVAIAGIPGEMTIQAGRRLQEQIKLALMPLGVQQVILTGLANEYSGYITTPEEYASQQYEGASTLYGRLTFDAYREIFAGLATAMAQGQPAKTGPPAPDLSAIHQVELQTGVIQDGTPPAVSFGQVLTEPPPMVARGAVVSFTYQAGHPKNDLRHNNSYIRIERDNGTDNWELVAWDAMPETKLFWGRSPNCPAIPADLLAGALCTWSSIGVYWTVPFDVRPGTYRIRFVGSYKNESGGLVRYQGRTRTFLVQ